MIARLIGFCAERRGVVLLLFGVLCTLALHALRHLAQDGRGFAILGHMAELGEVSRASHEDIGEYAARAELAGLIAVGQEAAPILAGARKVR